MFDVVTIGSATRDAFFEGDFPLVKWPKAESGKAYLLPFGEKLEAKKVYFTIGGNAANASATFSRQGLKTACVAKTGNDVSGEEIRRRLKKESVETKFIAYDSGMPTSYSVLLLESGASTPLSTGERTILNYRGAGGRLRIRDVNLKNLSARWWYMSLSGESDTMLKPLLKFANNNGIAVAFNPTGYHLKHKRSEILSCLGELSFLVLNKEEAALLVGISFKNEKAVFKKLDGLVSGILAVTDGKNGVTVSDGKFIYKAGIFKEKKLVDRTGAGDAFGSGFVAGLAHRQKTLLRKGYGGQARDKRKETILKPDDISYAIRLATANATSTVEKIGATEGLLTKNEFEKNVRWKNLKITTRKS